MMLFAGSSSSSTQDASSALNELSELLAGDWQSRKDEIASLVSTLADDDKLLRAFTRTYTDTFRWPELKGAQSFLVTKTDSMVVRLNLWFPGNESSVDTYRRYLSIDEIHNHDFDFFTACLFGPGYSTTFFRDETHHSARREFERVPLTDAETLKLEAGTVMFVECGRDFHMQHWPEAFSVTVNVIPRTFESGDRIQYILDGSHRIKTIINAKERPLASDP